MATQELRRKRMLRAVSVWMFSVSITVFGLLQLEGQWKRALYANIPDWVFDAILILTLVCFCVAILLWLLTLFSWRDSDPLYLSGELSLGEIPALRRFAVGYFGESFATEEKIRDWLGQWKDGVIVIRKVTRHGLSQAREILGFFILLPLTRHAVDLYTQNEITGATFLKEHIAVTRADCYGVYVAAIAGADAQARNSALLLLHRALEHYWKQGVQVVLARPTSQRGLELAVEFDMQPVPHTELDGFLLYARQRA